MTLASLASGQSRVVDRALPLRGTSPAIRLHWWQAPPRHLAGEHPRVIRGLSVCDEGPALPCSASFHPWQEGKQLSAHNGLRQLQPDAAVSSDPTATGSAHQPRGFWCRLGRDSRDGTECVMAESDEPQNKGMKQTKPGFAWSFAAYPRCSADLDRLDRLRRRAAPLPVTIGELAFNAGVLLTQRHGCVARRLQSRDRSAAGAAPPC